MSGDYKKEHRGYFRVSEAATRRIESYFDEPHVKRAALLVYFSLCRIANLEGCETFERPICSISKDVGYSYRETQRAIRNLKSIKLVEVQTRTIRGTKLKAPSTYVVRTMLPGASSNVHDAISIGSSGQSATTTQHIQEQPPRTPPIKRRAHTGYFRTPVANRGVEALRGVNSPEGY